MPTVWHSMEAGQALASLGTSAERGLTTQQVQERLARYGPNTLREPQPRSPLRIFVSQLTDFMVLVLIAAAILGGFIGEPEDTFAIAAIVLLNAVTGFVQEYRAERAMALLKKLAANHAHALRQGEVVTIAASELVPGDMVYLEAGAAVPADLRLLEVAQLRVDEATLTGESHPVEKQVAALESQDLPLGDRRNMAYKGTTVTSGRGRGIVVATGMETELGKIASLLVERGEAKTPLQRRLAQFGKRLALAALAICGIVFAAGVERGEPLVQMFLTAVSLAVAAIPEALPAVVTVTLALGARRMVRMQALVRRLSAVETLGSVTYICADKTGTLTQGKMQVAAIYADGKQQTEWKQMSGDEPWASLLRALALNNDARQSQQGERSGDPTEVALLQAAQEAGYDKTRLEARFPRVAELPFDPARKRMTTLHTSEGKVVALTKGAPEAVLACCQSVLAADGEQPLPAARLLETAEEMAFSGLRVLAFSSRFLPEVPALPAIATIEQEMTFLGFAGLMDPPRPEAKEAVAVCRAAGIVPVMITGDHPSTARAIAAQLGIASPKDKILTGFELAKTPEADLMEQVRTARVYARVNPEQKIQIVRALQQRGEFVAMTGDGVNDAPALQQADIGVAMGQGGTDVAREAADLVLLDNNFASIVAAVREGRHIYDNIRKFVKFVMASNSAEIWTIFLAPFLGLPIPLLPIQILWTNLVTDGLPGIALALEPADPTLMTRPPRPPRESLFARGAWQHMVWVGLLIAGLSIFVQAYALRSGSGHWQTMVFTVLTLSQMANVMAARSERQSLLRIGIFSNLPLLGAVLLTIALQLATIYLELLQQVFRTASLTGPELGLCLVLSAAVWPAVEMEKWMVRRGWLSRLNGSH